MSVEGLRPKTLLFFSYGEEELCCNSKVCIEGVWALASVVNEKREVPRSLLKIRKEVSGMAL